MTLVLIPVGRGNWKTRYYLRFEGPAAPGPYGFVVGQRLTVPCGYGANVVARVVKVLP
ncbi:MAG: hypothetical protein JWQ03_1630 [Variovorax sp.]|nr:hypothetical protein [Variovorax sp.]